MKKKKNILPNDSTFNTDRIIVTSQLTAAVSPRTLVRLHNIVLLAAAHPQARAAVNRAAAQVAVHRTVGQQADGRQDRHELGDAD